MVIEAGLATHVAIANSSVSGEGTDDTLPVSGRPASARGFATWAAATARTTSTVSTRRARQPLSWLRPTWSATVPRRRTSPTSRSPSGKTRRGTRWRSWAARSSRREKYFDEPMVVEPFRRADYCLASEGATCLILTSADRARSLAGTPVTIAAGEGIHAGRDDYIVFAAPGHGRRRQPGGPVSRRPGRRHLRAGRHHAGRRRRAVCVRLLHQQCLDDPRALRLLLGRARPGATSPNPASASTRPCR